MTETNITTSNPCDGERRAGTVGFPLPGVALRIADPETGEVLPQGETGVIAAFEPRSATSRRSVFQTDFARALWEDADRRKKREAEAAVPAVSAPAVSRGGDGGRRG